MSFLGFSSANDLSSSSCLAFRDASPSAMAFPRSVCLVSVSARSALSSSVSWSKFFRSVSSCCAPASRSFLRAFSCSSSSLTARSFAPISLPRELSSSLSRSRLASRTLVSSTSFSQTARSSEYFVLVGVELRGLRREVGPLH